MSQNSIEDYFQEVINIVASQESVNQENFTEEIFTLYMADILIESGKRKIQRSSNQGSKFQDIKEWF